MVRDCFPQRRLVFKRRLRVQISLGLSHDRGFLGCRSLEVGGIGVRMRRIRCRSGRLLVRYWGCLGTPEGEGFLSEEFADIGLKVAASSGACLGDIRISCFFPHVHPGGMYIAARS